METEKDRVRKQSPERINQGGRSVVTQTSAGCMQDSKSARKSPGSCTTGNTGTRLAGTFDRYRRTYALATVNMRRVIFGGNPSP
jgi:hypothetical protein